MLQILAANRAVIGAAVGLALLGGVYLGGRYHGGERCEDRHRASAFEATQDRLRLLQELAKRDAEIAVKTLEAERRIQIKYRTVTQEVVKHVPTDPVCALNDTAVGLLNGALGNRLLPAPADPGQPDGALPGLGPATGRHHGAPGGEARGGVQPVLPMSSPTLGPI